MLHPIYYMIDAEAVSNQEALPVSSVIALRINRCNEQALQKVYQNLQHANTDVRFCVYLPVVQNLDEAYIRNTIAFLFFPHYHQAAGVPVILLENGNQKGFETFCTALAEGAAQQGFKALKLIETKLEHEYKFDDGASNKERLMNDYQQALKSPIEKTFYIAVSEQSEIIEIHQELQKTENDFAAENKAVYNMQKENKALREKVEQLQYQLSVAEQEMSHMLSHMAVLGSTSQAGNLQNYYNNEYEVLPRWYKQLGHVLKVIQGKRTIQSLFDKTAKKYKS